MIKLLANRTLRFLFSNHSHSKFRIASFNPIKDENFRWKSTGVNLQEIEIQKEEEDDDEMIIEKEYAELKRALGMAFRQAYNPEQLLLIHPKLRKQREWRNTTPELEIEEAQTLCQTIPGYRVVSSIIVNTDQNVRKKLIWKSGRLEAIMEYKQQHNISAIMINVDFLSSVQQNELTTYFGVPIYDRYNIVLNIFRLYAKTKEARLQIALAEIPYIRERLKFITEKPGTPSKPFHLSSALTSILSNFNGCKNMEILRLQEQRIRKQIKTIMNATKNGIEELKEKGGPAKTPVIGIIGYTNSGKTTLIKKLTNSQSLFGENRLFATLDTTTHHVTLPSNNKCILVDTIGFISNLPINLFASFSATLQHVANADMLIHIMDFSHPNVLAQRDNVYETLENLKIRKSLMDNILNVGNKLDKCDSARREELMKMDFLAHPNGPVHTVLLISCRTAEGIPELIHRVDKLVQIMNGSKIRRLRLSPSSVAIPYLYDHGFVNIPPESSECGHFLIFDVLMNDNQFAKFQAALGTRFKRKGDEEEEKKNEF